MNLLLLRGYKIVDDVITVLLKRMLHLDLEVKQFCAAKAYKTSQ